MGFFDRIFRIRANALANPYDPTAAWPPSQGASPQVNLEQETVGSAFARLPFGSDVTEGQFLGRADDFSGNEHHFTLTYYKWGLDLSFEGRRLAEVWFRIGASTVKRDMGDTAATPTGPDGLQLSAATTEADLIARFGEPETRQDFDDESILYYNVGPLVSEFQVDSGKRLLAWTVYPD